MKRALLFLASSSLLAGCAVDSPSLSSQSLETENSESDEFVLSSQSEEQDDLLGAALTLRSAFESEIEKDILGCSVSSDLFLSYEQGDSSLSLSFESLRGSLWMKGAQALLNEDATMEDIRLFSASSSFSAESMSLGVDDLVLHASAKEIRGYAKEGDAYLDLGFFEEGEAIGAFSGKYVFPGAMLRASVLDLIQDLLPTRKNIDTERALEFLKVLANHSSIEEEEGYTYSLSVDEDLLVESVMALQEGKEESEAREEIESAFPRMGDCSLTFAFDDEGFRSLGSSFDLDVSIGLENPVTMRGDMNLCFLAPSEIPFPSDLGDYFDFQSALSEWKDGALRLLGFGADA